MTPLIEVFPKNEAFVIINTTRDIDRELTQYFSLEAVPYKKNHKKVRYTARGKGRHWDGMTRFYSYTKHELPKGLLYKVVDFCQERKYRLSIDPSLLEQGTVDPEKFVKELGIIHVPHDFQYDALKKSIESGRRFILSPTSSGKSLLLFALTMWYLKKTKKKVLIVVPFLGLLEQLKKEFGAYSPSIGLDNHIHLISGGCPVDDPTKMVYIATYHSLVNQHHSYYEQFGCVMVDEVHRSYDQVKKILDKCKTIKHRFGFTGTLDGTKIHLWKTESITGRLYSTIKTNILIKRGLASSLNILCFMFKYSEKYKTEVTLKMAQKPKEGLTAAHAYNQKLEYIVNLPERNQKIKDIILNAPNNKNTLVLTDRLQHVQILSEYLKGTNKKVVLINGTVSGENREKIREFTENNENVVIIGTYGTISTGTNIKNLQNIIFATSGKTQIKLLQSIGRGLRKDGKDNKLNVIDITDDFNMDNPNKDYFIQHFRERLKIYVKEEFDYKTYHINI